MKRWQRLAGLMGILAGFWLMAAEGRCLAEPVQLRGIVEGFYGTPWQQQERLDILDFCREKQFNAYIYAPKDDPWQRAKWREPYPADKLAALGQLVKQAKKDGVHFIFAVSPGLDVRLAGDGSEDDREAMVQKLETMYQLGVRDFAIFWDDIENKDGREQARFVNWVFKRLQYRHADLGTFITVPTEYFRQDMEDRDGRVKTYTKNFSRSLDPHVLVLYTGEGVAMPSLTDEELQQADALYGRRLGLWWNYPVNDYMESKLALGPVTNLPQHNSLPAVFFNPMKYEELSKIALATGADYALDPAHYDPEKSWQAAIVREYGPLAEDMARFAAHSQHLSNDWADIGRPDGEEFRRKAERLLASWPDGVSAAADYQAVAADLAAMDDSLQRLQKNLPDASRTECEPQLQQMARLVRAGKTALALLQAEKDGQPGERLALHRSLSGQYAGIKAGEEKARLSEESGVYFLQQVLTKQVQKKE